MNAFSKMTYADMAKLAQKVEHELELSFDRSTLLLVRQLFAEAFAKVSAPGRTPEREAAYESIDSERTYQDSKWGRVGKIEKGATQQTGSSTLGEGVGNRSLDEFALYIFGYADDLMRLASHTNDPAPKREFVRKVAGLCVACMEQHGAPHRVTK